MRGLRSKIKELAPERVGFVFGSGCEGRIENVLQGWGRARPDSGKGFTLNRQFAEHQTHRIGAEIDIGQGRVPANGHWRTARRPQGETGLD